MIIFFYVMLSEPKVAWYPKNISTNDFNAWIFEFIITNYCWAHSFLQTYMRSMQTRSMMEPCWLWRHENRNSFVHWTVCHIASLLFCYLLIGQLVRCNHYFSYKFSCTCLWDNQTTRYNPTILTAFTNLCTGLPEPTTNNLKLIM